MNNKSKSLYILLAVILIIILGYKCPLSFLLGLSCPFCGFSRALFYALILDFENAFYFYAFWPIVLILIVIHILDEFNLIKLNKKIFLFILIIFALLNLIYYFYRLFNESEIVYFNFEESLIYKLISFFQNFC